MLAAIDSDVSCTAGPDHGPVYKSFCENALDQPVAYLADLPANHSWDNNATNGNETIRWLATAEQAPSTNSADASNSKHTSSTRENPVYESMEAIRSSLNSDASYS